MLRFEGEVAGDHAVYEDAEHPQIAVPVAGRVRCARVGEAEERGRGIVDALEGWEKSEELSVGSPNAGERLTPTGSSSRVSSEKRVSSPKSSRVTRPVCGSHIILSS